MTLNDYKEYRLLEEMKKIDLQAKLSTKDLYQKHQIIL
jgi:hypothetical protein